MPFLLLILACAQAPEPAAPAPEPAGQGAGVQTAPAGRTGQGGHREHNRRSPGAPGGQPQPVHLVPELSPTRAPDTPQRPILIISLDTVRADHLALYGGPAQVPNLAALAAQGVVVEHAISHYPETCLSHWSMLSGVLPEVHGNVPATRGSAWTGPTLVEVARAEGYATGGFIGGVTLTDTACGFGRGFDHFDDRFRIDPADMKRPGAELSRRAARWIRQQEGPFVAFVHYFDAHFPYTPAPPWDTAYDPEYTGALTGSDADLGPYRDGTAIPSAADLRHAVALYQGELSELDALIAPVLAAMPEDAVVVVTSDHGESFEHGYLFNHRDSLWDSTLRVPLVIRAPGLPPQTRMGQQFGLIDLAPTVLALAGLPGDAAMQGGDRSQALMGAPVYGAPQVLSTTDPWRERRQMSLRTLDHKVLRGPEGDTLAFDLNADPGELRPLAAAPPGLGDVAEIYAQALAPSVDPAGIVAEQAEAPRPQARQKQLRKQMQTEDEIEALESLGYTAY